MARVLAIHAHPDDLEILAGGTLVLLAERGHQVAMATMTPGDCGSSMHLPDEIAAIRRQEAASSAALIGAAYECIEFRDMAVFNDDAARRRVTEVLRRLKPELVLTASPADYMADHEATSALVRDSCFAAPVPNYRTGSRHPAPPLAAIPHLYFLDPIGGVDRDGCIVLPDFVVNVTDTFARKTRMLAQHRSQREWLLAQHGIDDYLEQMQRWTEGRGAMGGFGAGEGFRRYKGHPYPQDSMLEDLLGAEFVGRPRS